MIVIDNWILSEWGFVKMELEKIHRKGDVLYLDYITKQITNVNEITVRFQI